MIKPLYLYNMYMQPIFLALATFVSTYLGGTLAIKLKDKLHYIMALSAGVLLGVVSFDILPEIIDQVNRNNFASMGIMAALVVGFLLFHILEKSILIHNHKEGYYAEHRHPQVGVWSALALISHSFMDGIGIGLGFQVSPTVGVLVAIAVISHDFTDGMNTVALMLHHKNDLKRSRLMLVADALAPILGAASTLLFRVSEHTLTLYLGFFAGFLLYIGLSDILPEAHSRQSSYKLIGLTVLGVLLIFVISLLA